MFNPNQMKKLMKQMNMQPIDAVRVEIFTHDKKIVLDNPDVTKMSVMGEVIFQIKGDEHDESLEEEIEISPDDIALVAEKAGVSKTKAREALEETNGDLMQAIKSLK